jgi:hypothetical protein
MVATRDVAKMLIPSLCAEENGPYTHDFHILPYPLLNDTAI